MPVIRHYTVTQTRQVDVAANSVGDACRIAEAAFEHGQNSDNGVANDKGPADVWGNTVSRVRVKEIWGKEKE